ncbi:MAG: methyltransferase [Planctomycetaceae bacterium]
MSDSETNPLPAIPGGWQIQTITLPCATFQLAMPAIPDAMLDQAIQRIDDGGQEIAPYWTYLWPTAAAMATCVMRESWRPGTRALEIGCGIGLVGIAGLAVGLHVTFSDYIPEAVQLSIHNATLNRLTQHRALCLDWNVPDTEQFDVLLANDVLYDRRDHKQLLRLIRQMMTPDGACWMGDPCRPESALFVEQAATYDLDVEVVPSAQVDWNTTAKPSVDHQRFQLIKLTRSSGSASPSTAAIPSLS